MITANKKFNTGDLVMINGNVETVRKQEDWRVFTDESWERGRTWYSPSRVVLLETAEEAQAHSNYIEDAGMYAELSRGM